MPTGASTSLVSTLIAQTEDLARPQDFGRTVSTERLKKFGAMALVVPLIALLGFAAGRETCSDLLKRVLLSSVPVPRRTRVLVPEGNRTIGIGDTVRLEAFVQGIIPGHGKVEVRHRSRRPQEFSLEQSRANSAGFARTLENVQDSFSYRFSLGDGVSEVFSIQAIARPTIATMECDQDYPAYTRLKSARRNLGDLTLLAGSVLHLKATATKDIRSASLKLAGLDQELPLALNPQAPR